ncbi:MAG: antibiotic biosynthesis monooxygenase [Lentisphaeria bacterium]|nr:antibiotic biosynthesis monooxygenase [Lentisphaeria bacterium]
MIHVVARMEIKPGCMEQFLKILLDNTPTVLAEKGCCRYESCLDTKEEDKDKYVTILESWESEEHLKAHLATPHMANFREAVKDLRVSSNVTVMAPVKR